MDRYQGKIFCIGLNKTGTCSLTQALTDHGYRFLPQLKGELQLDTYLKGDIQQIIETCINTKENYDAFQDVPFSLPHTYRQLYRFYPKAKYILTVRSDFETWYNSIIRFHTGLIHNLDHLSGFAYIRKGWLYDIMTKIYGCPKDDPYNKECLRNCYELHIQAVQNFFAHAPNQLLVIDIAKKDSYSKLCQFLSVTPKYGQFPWLNRS